MANKGRSEPNLFGGYTHYDEKGHKIGKSEPNLFGGYTNYDAKGKKTGTSGPGIFGGLTHYDVKGNRIGRSDPGVFGSWSHYDSHGKKTGSSDPKVFGGYRNSGSTDACYIATCVYGSYDCPEVWTLRRFRDGTLRKHLPGRMFVRVYYALSPALVRLFGETKWFRSFWKRRLDKMVLRLRERGIDSRPYTDIK